MMAQFVNAQPNRNGEARADHRDGEDRGGGRPDSGTGLAAATHPPPDRCRRDDRHYSGHHRTADLPEDSGRRHRPSGQCRGDQPQVQPVDTGVQRPHARTRSRSFSSRAGPMPSTSPSWSTLVNRPLASRQAMIAAAVTEPIPGNASSSATVAVFRSTKSPSVGVFPAGDALSVGTMVAGPELVELPIAAGWPG